MNPVRELIRQNRVMDLGPLPAPRIEIGATLQQALQNLVRGRRGAVVVVEDLKPVGIFTERDVLYRLPDGLFMSRDDRRMSPLREIISQPVVSVRRQVTLLEAIEVMARLQHRHLVVVDGNGDLRGLLTTTDLVQFLTDQFPEDVVNLPPRLDQQYRSSEGA